MCHKFILLSALVTIFIFHGRVYAGDDSFRCGGDLISLGDTMFEVQSSCGEPASEQIIGERNVYRYIHKKKYKIESTYYLTEWIYEGNNGIYLLIFEGSRLVEKNFIFD